MLGALVQLAERMNSLAQPLAGNNHLLGVSAVPKIAVTGAGLVNRPMPYCAMWRGVGGE